MKQMVSIMRRVFAKTLITRTVETLFKTLFKTKIKTIVLWLSAFSMLGITTPSAYAKSKKIQLGRVAYSGSACPGGSVSTGLNGSKTSIHVNFKQYVVEAHGRNKPSSKKTCQIAIPIKVPPGVSISLVSARYNGKVSLPAGTEAKIMNAYSFSGKRGKRFRSVLRGPNTKGYSFNDPLSSFASLWTGCGKDTTLRITTSTRVKTGGSPGKTLADSRQGFVTQLRYRSCQ